MSTCQLALEVGIDRFSTHQLLEDGDPLLQGLTGLDQSPKLSQVVANVEVTLGQAGARAAFVWGAGRAVGFLALELFPVAFERLFESSRLAVRISQPLVTRGEVAPGIGDVAQSPDFLLVIRHARFQGGNRGFRLTQVELGSPKTLACVVVI